MLWSDCRGKVVRCRVDELNRIACRNVLKHNLQVWEVLMDLPQVAIDKYLLSIENIHIIVGHLSMNQQKHSALLHGFEGWV